ADIYEKTGNYVEEAKIYDIFMFHYLATFNDPQIVNLFTDLLIRSIFKKLQIWDFNSINDIFKRIKDQRILRSNKYQAIKESIQALQKGDITTALRETEKSTVLFQRRIREFLETYMDQIKEDIYDQGKLNIYQYKKEQTIAPLIDYLIQDLYARKEITGKYYPMGLFVSHEPLTTAIDWCEKELQEKGKAEISDIVENTDLNKAEAVTVIERELLPQKLQAVFNKTKTILYSYLTLRNEVEVQTLEAQKIGTINIEEIANQLKIDPGIIEREIEYLILEGKINPRIVGRET
ncbi:MAG: hypothetical protein U9O98_04650, partial [Asgard group archaeon]|nr:hypothetical protein [Asgard group archaeon]